MDISSEIAAIQEASRGSEVRQPIVDALNKMNGGTLPVVSASDAKKILVVNSQGQWVASNEQYVPTPTGTQNITQNGTYDVTDKANAVVNVQPDLETLSVTQNGTYTPPSGKDGFDEVNVNVSGGSSVLVSKTITQNGTYDPQDDNADGYSGVTVNVQGGGGTIEPLTATQNGTYTPPSGVDGYAPVVVNVPSGGGATLMTRAEWNALTTAQKKSYQYVGIIDSQSGYNRGSLVYGADYGAYLPYSDESKIICNAFIENYLSSVLSWGDGNNPVTIEEGMHSYDSANNAVLIQNTTTKCGAYVDLGAASTPFTAYIVAKASSPGSYSRLISAFANRGSGGGIMLYGGTIKVSSWANDSNTSKSASNYFAGAITFGGSGDAAGAVDNGNGSPSYITKPPTQAGRYIAIGRTDIDSSATNAEPCNLYVRYVGVVSERETQTVIMNNLAALVSQLIS